MAALAERQHGVVSTGQLLAAGLSRGAIERRVRRGRLHRVHRGVFAVGHRRLGFKGKLWAAVLACGGPDVAALSHRSAAAVWDLLPAPAGKVDVVTLSASHSRAGIRIHRGAVDRVTDIMRSSDGLPVTSASRTLLDLAAVLTPHRLDRLCHRSQFLGVLDSAALDRLLDRTEGRPGTGRLRRALERLAIAKPQVTRSELEERFLSLVAGSDLPLPHVNTLVAGHEVDFLWPQARLIAETDGVAAHLTPLAFEQDRRRDATLLVAGYRVIRFTWHEIAIRPGAVARTLQTLLAGSS